MEGKAAFSLCRAQKPELEVEWGLLLWHIFRHQLEAKALVVRWIASEHAAKRTTCRNFIKSRANELTADAPTLALRQDRNRAQAIPRFRSVTQSDRGKSHLAYQLPSIHSDER